MKEIIVALRWDDEKLGTEFINLEALEALFYSSVNTHPGTLKIVRIWEPELFRICKCGRKGYHLEWSLDQGEEWSCCDCWVAKGNAPAPHHARLKKNWLGQVRELIENNTMGLIRIALLEPVKYAEGMAKPTEEMTVHVNIDLPTDSEIIERMVLKYDDEKKLSAADFLVLDKFNLWADQEGE